MPTFNDAEAASSIRTKLNANITEVETARGGAATLAARLSTISNFASPNAGGIVVGQHYDNSFHGTASGTLIGAAGRIDLAPFLTSIPLRIDRLGVSVSTGVASALGRVAIYAAGADGWPAGLLLQTGDLDFSAAAYANGTVDFTFASGTTYWLGVWHSSTATIRTIPLSSAANLGLSSATASNYATVLRRTITWGTALPNPWAFVSGDLASNITPPSVRFRAAAL